MKPRRWITLTLLAGLLLGVPTFSAQATNLAGTQCRKVGEFKTSGKTTFKCTKKTSKLVWLLMPGKVVAPTPVQTSSAEEVTPDLVPEFTVIEDAIQITLNVSLPSLALARSQNISNVKAILSRSDSGGQYIVRLEKRISEATIDSSVQAFIFRDPTPIIGQEWNAEVIFANSYGFGSRSSQKITRSISTSTPMLTPPPAPTPTQTPTPTPVTVPTVTPTATPTPTVTGCNPKSIPSLPWASQKIAITQIDWKTDSLGYVYLLLKMRNDVAASLRVVQYQFSYWYGLSLRSTSYNTGTSTVEHFFVKDDPKFMGEEQISGSWIQGQSRTFRLDLNEILDCSKISLTNSNFTVLQGIGG